MQTTNLCLLVFTALVGGSSFAMAQEAGLVFPEEQAVLDAAMIPVTGEGTWKLRQKKREFTYQKGNSVLRAEVSPETGRVIAIFGNAPPITNAELRKFADSLPDLQRLAFDHWGNWAYKEIGREQFDGSGMIAFEGKKLEEFRVGGCQFNNDGIRAVAQIDGLKTFRDSHTAIDYPTALPILAQNKSLERLIVGSDFSDKFNGSHLELIKLFPQLKELTIAQTYLNFDGGLHHLVALKDRLKRIEFSMCLVFPEDLERLRSAMPTTEVVMTPELKDPRHQALSGPASEKFALPRFQKWIPAEAYQRLLEFRKELAQ